MQDVIHWNNFFEHWNKQHADFEQSSTDNLKALGTVLEEVLGTK